mgnify:CR=1 FL=1
MRLTEKKNDIYANITFKDSMIRYADERFVNIELILEDESGLKIPKTSVTEKDCYAVPIDYITSGGALRTKVSTGRRPKKERTTTEFIPVTIINEDTESGNCISGYRESEKRRYSFVAGIFRYDGIF